MVKLVHNIIKIWQFRTRKNHDKRDICKDKINHNKPDLSPLRGSLTSTFLSTSFDHKPVDYAKFKKKKKNFNTMKTLHAMEISLFTPCRRWVARHGASISVTITIFILQCTYIQNQSANRLYVKKKTSNHLFISTDESLQHFSVPAISNQLWTTCPFSVPVSLVLGQIRINSQPEWNSI